MKYWYGVLLWIAAGVAAAESLVSWESKEQLEKWTRIRLHQCAASVSADALRVVCSGWDGHIYSPAFEIPAKSSQVVAFRAKGDRSGAGELFWMTPGKGAVQQQSCRFEWIGDGQWHEYRVRPFWQGEKAIGGIRVDFPASAADGGVFEISRLAVEEAQPLVTFSSDEYTGVTFTASGKGIGTLLWVSEGKSGVQRTEFRLPGDSLPHRYYLNLSASEAWNGKVSCLGFEMTDGAAAPTDLKPVADEPDIHADLVVHSVRVADAVNRVGQPIPITILLRNIGTMDAREVTVAAQAPEGFRVMNADELSKPATVEGGAIRSFTAILTSDREAQSSVQFIVRAAGMPPVETTCSVRVMPSLHLPRAEYVPEPKPVKTDYDLAALYFPGWGKVQAWERIWNVCPERKPVLGWYDEANPEVVDWQIKWLVENGIRTLYVDWYWDRGRQHHDHWVKAFYRAKYRGLMKWAMMWANHNPQGSHSETDQRAVTKFWIENYFDTPEYLRIDGKPAVWIWSPEGMERDLGKGGCRRLLEISREMAREAGLGGIYFLAMKWPEADCSPQTVQKCKDMGFDMTSIYHFMDHGGRSESHRRFPFSQVADANPENWRALHKAGILPFLPNLSTGWDDRPWNDQCEIYGKNVKDFRRICEAAKAFADETGIKRLCLSPLNEWGEGSYAEPNAEFGFGFYEAVRETFCQKPTDGWPLNYAPKDVKLGPYDLAAPLPPKHLTEWDCTAGQPDGWSGLMGMDGPRRTGTGLAYRTTSRDPAILLTFAHVKARDYREVVVRMRATGVSGSLQLFWGESANKMRETASLNLPIHADGQWHDYVFPVAGQRTWRGRIGALRIDPGIAADAEVEFARVKLVSGL